MKAKGEDGSWEAVLARDARADGMFLYAVTTTGVYCLPSCPSRRPRREHVRFFATTAEAESAGFRDCQRCKPKEGTRAEQKAEVVASICRHIEQADEPPTLAKLAASAGRSPFHLQRMFREVTGVTPRQYAAGLRLRKVRERISCGDAVTDAVYASGFQSSGRFYAVSNTALGMTPTAFKKGGKDMTIQFGTGQSTLGAVLVAESARGICAILLGDDAHELRRDLRNRFPEATLVPGDAAFQERVKEVIGLVESPAGGVGLPLDIQGTAFQQRVWETLRAIPAGQTASYLDIAAKLQASGAVRAVAQACGANALAVAIPCHRVVRSDGGLSGYRWGVERKRALLEREGRNLSPLSK